MPKKQFSKRPKPFKDQIPVVFIFCEGENTEIDYFNSFRIRTVKIRSIGIGKNPAKLIEKASRIIKAERYEEGSDQKWCVFDKDDIPSNDFDNAVLSALNNGFKVAWSNQSFEYWFLLHFEDHQGGSLQRDQYDRKINRYIKDDRAKYNLDGRKKVSEEFAAELFSLDKNTGRPRLKLAMERAARIYQVKSDLLPSQTESCTTVYKLVEILLGYADA